MFQGYELPPVDDEDPSQGRGPVIRTAYPSEAEKLTATVVAGCSDMPLCEWLAPDAARRRGVLTGYFRILVTHLLDHGYVEVVDGERLPLAVAGWLPANAPPTPPDYAEQLALATSPWADRFRALDDEAARTRAHGHRRLVFLAVFPRAQRGGLGSALLGHHLRGLDDRGIRASVEAVGVQAVSFYRKHGFSAHGTPIAVAVTPDAECVLTPMRRSPRPRVGITAATRSASRSGTPSS